MASAEESGHIIDLANGYMYSEMLFTAINLGVFDAVEKLGDKATPTNIAKETGASSDPLERLMNGLAGLKLLIVTQKENGERTFGNSNATSRYLRKGSDKNLIGLLKNFDAMRVHSNKLQGGVEDEENLPVVKTYRKGDSSDNKQGDMVKDLEWRTRFHTLMDHMVETSFPLFDQLDISKFKKCVDLGGSLGTLAKHVKSRYPAMDVSVIDLPMTMQIARELADKNQGKEPQINYVDGDFFAGNLPSADLYILSHVTNNWKEEQCALIVRNIHKALEKGGSLLILDKVLDADKSGPINAHLLDIDMMLYSRGRLHTEAEFRQLLEGEKFSNVTYTQHKGEVPQMYDAIMAVKEE